MALPEAFTEQIKQLLGDEFPAYLESFSQERVYGLRINDRKLTTEQFEQIAPCPVEPIPWIPNGYYYRGESKPAKHPFYFGGLYYLQEPSAMTPAHLLDPQPGDRVLDLCAAPGGKSTQLGAALQGKGVLVSNDISNSRAKALLKNLELFGIPNSVILSEAPYKLVPAFPEYFDKILIDAPCSGEGMFRKEPSVMKSWLEKGNSYFAKLQREIVLAAVKMLKPGGKLLYSTCTFAPEENEATIQFLLDECPEMHVIPVERYEGFGPGLPDKIEHGSPELVNCVRIWPQRIAGEGHFLALLQKDGICTPNVPISVPEDRSLAQDEEFQTFLSGISDTFDKSRMTARGEWIQQLPDQPLNLEGLRILRCGLLMGERKKNRFEPSQALAMALDAPKYANRAEYSIDDDRVIRYLKGETITSPEGIDLRGWVLVCVQAGGHSYPLGFAKGMGATLKNKYLAGWRWQ